MPFTPTAEQDAILRHPVGTHARLLAGPGTGKSATLIEWLGRHPLARAKLLTFTRAATAELVAKLSTREDIDLDRPSTIHSFCISVLMQNEGVGGFPRPFRMADDWEFDELVSASLARRLHIDKRSTERLFTELAANWESLSPTEDERVDAPARSRFMGAWNEHRAILGYTLLAELPWALRSALASHSDLDGIDHSVLIVDEYQDLNACDLEVLHLISERGVAIVAAGDDDQSIYSFRKAHPAGIRRFLTDYVGAMDYPLTITRRCARRIVEWANYVIQGDLDRPVERGALRAADEGANGEVALLSFASNGAEAHGVGALAKHLATDKHIPYSEILILLRSDYNGQFSKPIKEELTQLGIAYTDANDAKAVFADLANRKTISILRLAVNGEDSLAWASVLHLAKGIGATFFDYIYERARASHSTFGHTLLQAYDAGYPDLSTVLRARATALVRDIKLAVTTISVPDEVPEAGWGAFIIAQSASSASIQLSDEFKALLLNIDERVEDARTLERYLGQMAPIAKDIALEKTDRVRIMSLAGSKGLTVRAAIIVGLEEGIVPLEGRDLAEERRLLYVGLTRAEQYAFGTWALRRLGPTARTGRTQVHERRRVSSFVEGGPVVSEDGNSYLARV